MQELTKYKIFNVVGLQLASEENEENNNKLNIL